MKVRGRRGGYYPTGESTHNTHQATWRRTGGQALKHELTTSTAALTRLPPLSLTSPPAFRLSSRPVTVIVSRETDQIVATGTLLVERKFIRGSFPACSVAPFSPSRR